MRGVRCAHDPSERRASDNRCRACDRDRWHSRKAGVERPIVGAHAHRAMTTQLRDMGLDEYAFRYDAAQPYALTRGDFDEDGNAILVREVYCPDGYLEGEPCPHGCWSAILAVVAPSPAQRRAAPRTHGRGRYVVLPDGVRIPCERSREHPDGTMPYDNSGRTLRGLTFDPEGAARELYRRSEDCTAA